LTPDGMRCEQARQPDAFAVRAILDTLGAQVTRMTLATASVVVSSVVPWEVLLMSTVPVIVPISELRQDAAGLFKRVVALDEPVFVTQRGRASVVIQSTYAYERVQHENEILKLLVQGDADIAAGVGRDAEDVLAEARALLASE
jgi:prevent-host-death family protein